MPKMLIAPLDGLVAIPFEKPLTRDLVFIYPRDRPLTAATRAVMAHVRAGVQRARASGATLAGGRYTSTSYFLLLMKCRPE